MAVPRIDELRSLRSGPLALEPRTEQGVVALFAGICRERFGLRVTDIETRFPDCYAKHRNGREIGIEFEYESSRFTHDRAKARPTPSGERGHCDWVVCWIDNAKRGESWRRTMKVVELARFFPELSPAVWIQPYSAENVARLAGRKRHIEWTVPSRARKGDLLLVYRTGAHAAITHILGLTTTAEFDKRHPWGWGFQANMKTIIEIPNPVSRSDLQKLPELDDVSFIKRPTPLGQNVVGQWPAILKALLTSNPRAGIKKAVSA